MRPARRSPSALFPLLLSALVAVQATACSSAEPAAAATSESAADLAGPLAVDARYEVRGDVRRIDAERWDALVIQHDGPELWLRPEAKRALALEPGAVNVVSKRGVLKAAEVREEGDRVVVVPAPVAFSDFIEDGDIAVTGRTRFEAPFTDHAGDVYAKNLRVAGAIAPTSRQETALVDAAREMILEGWHVKKKALSTNEGDSLRYELHLSKTDGAFDADVHLAGTVKELGSALRVRVRQHVTTSQSFDVRTSGDGELSWAIRTHEGAIGYNKILAPGATFTVAFLLGELPMVLKVKTQIGITIGATGARSVTTGKVRLVYSNEGGVAVSGDAGGGTGGGSGEVSFEKEQGTVAPAAAAFGIVASLPKVELGMGIDGFLVGGVSFSNVVKSVVETAGAVGGSPCADIETKLTGRVGMVLEVPAGLATSLAKGGLSIAKELVTKDIYESKRTDTTCGFSTR